MTTYCKDIANLLFWELWECWTIPIKNHSINLKETFMLTCTQKFKLITLLSMILQKNSKYNILGKLGMPGHTRPKWWYQFQEIFNVYLQAKNRLCPSSFPWDIANKLQTCYFWYFGHACLWTSKLMLSAIRNLSCLSASKKSTSSLTFFERYCKDMQTSSFGYFGHAWLRTSKVIV